MKLNAATFNTIYNFLYFNLFICKYKTLVPTFADRGCRVDSATDPPGR
jgi:hypothetical protein